MSAKSALGTIDVMRAIDSEYRAHTGFTDSRFYKIFYSRINPAPLLVVGVNPGGNPGHPSSLMSASSSFFENYEHDYVDCSYTIQRMMLPLLEHALKATPDQIRAIPKTNLAFRRSPGEADFKKHHGMSLTDGMKESKPWLERIIRHVKPRMILLETMKPEAFALLYGGVAWSRAQPIADELCANHRGAMVRAFSAKVLPIGVLNMTIPVVAIGHPSVGSFSKPSVWQAITASVFDVCRAYDIQVSR